MKLKFLNLNIWEGGKLKKEITEFLNQEKPDIVTLQEVWRDSSLKKFVNIDEITSGLELRYRFFSPCFSYHVNQQKITLGNAILSKFPTRKEETRFLDIPYDDNYIPARAGDWSDTPRNIQHTEIDVNGTFVRVFNLQGIWGFDGLDTERRLAMGKIISDSIKGKEKVILAGDFNVQESSKTIGQIEENLENIFKNERITSFNLKQKDPNSGYAKAIVDLVMISSDIKTLSHKQPDINISDHLPQVCEFEV